VVIAIEVFKVKVERSRSYAYKYVNAITAGAYTLIAWRRGSRLLLFYCHYTSFVVAAVIKHPITKAFLQKFVSKRQAFAVIIADMLNVMLSMHTAMTMREFVWSFVARSVSTASASRNLVMYCRTLFFRCILISRLPYVENLLHFNFADFPVYLILLFYSNRENLMLAKYTFYSIGSQWRGKMEGETGLRTLAWKEVLKMVYY